MAREFKRWRKPRIPHFMERFSADCFDVAACLHTTSQAVHAPMSFGGSPVDDLKRAKTEQLDLIALCQCLRDDGDGGVN
jgi:hypothetical protein